MKIGYNRVSSATQSLELGREALITAGVPESRIYEEKVSGKSRGNRPELKAMLKALQPNDEVIVHKLDRLCRNAKDLLTIADDICNAGASLNILDLGINTGTPVGKMIITVLGAVSELERSYINDRTRAGIRAYIESLAGRWDRSPTKSVTRKSAHLPRVACHGQRLPRKLKYPSKPSTGFYALTRLRSTAKLI